MTFRVAEPATAATRLDFGIDPDTRKMRARALDQVGGMLTEIAQSGYERRRLGRGERHEYQV